MVLTLKDNGNLGKSVASCLNVLKKAIEDCLEVRFANFWRASFTKWGKKDEN